MNQQPILFLLILTLTLWDVSADNELPFPNVCEFFLHNLTTTLFFQDQDMSIEAKNFFLYSGHNINDLGMYETCKRLPTQRYSLMTFSTGSIGVCGPSTCNIYQLQNYANLLIKIFSYITKTDLRQLDILFVDPDKTGIEKGFWYYLTILIYSVIFGLILAGTISANFIKRKRIPLCLQLSDNSPDLSSSATLLINRESYSQVVSQELVRVHPQDQPPESTSTQEKSEFIKVIECFDIASNFQSLFKNEEVAGQDQNLNIFNGIRALAFGWVVYGHTFTLSATAKNYGYTLLVPKVGWSLVILAAYYAVDTFFFLSGFFTGFILVSKLKKLHPSIRNYTYLLFHRWIRLWPAYFIAILFYWKIAVYIGSGPLWWSYVKLAQICDGEAWKNFLFLDNVLNGSDQTYCFDWGWYLACDFQMFLLTPFICWYYIKNRGRGKTLILVLMAISVIVSYIESSNAGFTYFLMPNSNISNDYILKYYINPIVRMTPYLLGLLLGLMYREHKDKQNNIFSWLKDSSIKSITYSCSGFGLLLLIIFFPRDLQVGSHWSPWFATSWNILTRTVWTLGIFLLTAPCLVGHIRWLTRFLSNFYFTLIARVSYTGYLLHLIFLSIIFSCMNQYYGISQSYQIALSFSCMLVSCAGAMVLHLCVEKPIASLENLILKAKK